jgi:hypothetical protein
LSKRIELSGIFKRQHYKEILSKNEDMAHEHNYKLTAVWTGNKDEGTKNVRGYDRSHIIYSRKAGIIANN